MRRILPATSCVAAALPAPPFLLVQEALRALDAAAQSRDYACAATGGWDALNEAHMRDVRVMNWMNDMPYTAQRLAFERDIGAEAAGSDASRTR